MPHILTGDWRSSIIQDGVPRADETFHLNINEATGQIMAGSTHGGGNVTGAALPGNSPVQHIRIDKGTDRKYRGFLMVNGPVLILVGFLNRDPGIDFRENEFTNKEISNFFDQLQDVWVATKP